jgi:acetyl-CoA acyltransferase
MSEVFILSAARSPLGIGKPNGALSTIHPVHLTAMVLQESVRRAGVEMQQIEDVILGCVTPICEQDRQPGAPGIFWYGTIWGNFFDLSYLS